MGYSEARCHICGVSFNLGRTRRPDEPIGAGWAEYGFAWLSDSSGGCEPKKHGCTWREIPLEEQNAREGGKGLVTGALPREQTEHWVRRFLEEEYLKDEEAREGIEGEDGGLHGWMERTIARLTSLTRTVKVGEHGEDQGDEEEDRGNLGGNTGEGVTQHDTGEADPEVSRNVTGEVQEGAQDPVASDRGEARNGEHEEGEDEFPPADHRSIEHLAGRGCINFSAYNGYNISVEELRLSRTVQCLCRKMDGKPQIYAGNTNGPFVSEDDDEDFERDSDFFLSGITDSIGEREQGGPEVLPVRHGVSRTSPETIVWPYDPEQYCLPFHPYCFEVFKRASIARLGFIDIEGLTARWVLEGENRNGSDDTHQDPNVARCDEQWWGHVNGTEYLAANPLYMRPLVETLKSCIETDPEFNIRNGAFTPLARAATSSAPGKDDPFEVLPSELRHHLLSHLGSRDIASLRLASRAFHQLPGFLFRDLLRREKPWFWEALCERHLPYSKWAALRELDLENEELAAKKARIAIKRFQPDKAPVSAGKLKAWIEEARPSRPEQEFVQLPLEKTNWYKLSTRLAKLELSGLRNRKRIWADCEEILNRVEKYREKGEIPLSKSLEEITAHR